MNILEKLSDNKRNISITIDRRLYEKLVEIKLNNSIKSLSPLINEILWDWVDNNIKPNKVQFGDMAGSHIITSSNVSKNVTNIFENE